MVGSTKPVPNFDPLGLATLGSDATLAWFRAAELKHSRVAMLATTGYLVQAAGFHFPGMLSSDVSFESLSTMKPLDAWCAVPAEGKPAYLMLSLCCHHLLLTHTHLYILILCRPSSDFLYHFLGRSHFRVGEYSLHQGRSLANHCLSSH